MRCSLGTNPQSPPIARRTSPACARWFKPRSLPSPWPAAYSRVRPLSEFATPSWVDWLSYACLQGRCHFFGKTDPDEAARGDGVSGLDQPHSVRGTDDLSLTSRLRRCWKESRGVGAHRHGAGPVALTGGPKRRSHGIRRSRCVGSPLSGSNRAESRCRSLPGTCASLRCPGESASCPHH